MNGWIDNEPRHPSLEFGGWDTGEIWDVKVTLITLTPFPAFILIAGPRILRKPEATPW
jgi:hypothetical protein